MQIDTIRFGQVEIEEKKIITFSGGLPGLEEYRRFAVLQFEEGNPILWLQCVQAPDVCLPVIDSFSLEPNYAFNLADEDVAELDLQKPEELHVLSVLVIPDDIQAMTANMAAPIVINTRTNQAKQVVLGGGEYNVRMPAFGNICNMIKGGEADAGAVKKD